MCNRKLETLDPATSRIQVLIDLSCSLSSWPVEFNAFMQGLGPAWDVGVIAKAYNLTLVDKTMYTGILRQLSPVDILALYYVFGKDSFERGPAHLF